MKKKDRKIHLGDCMMYRRGYHLTTLGGVQLQNAQQPLGLIYYHNIINLHLIISSKICNHTQVFSQEGFSIPFLLASVE